MQLVKSKSGKPLYVFTVAEVIEAQDSQSGYCVRCGNLQGGCEPDARKVECEACADESVYGAEELALMGLVR